MYLYPCQDCSDRVVGCHSTCQKYKEARASHKKKFEEIQKVKKAEDSFDDYKIRRVEATKRNGGRK